MPEAKSSVQVTPEGRINPRGEEPMSEAKPYVISKQVVWEAYLKVKANHGAAGVDGAVDRGVRDRLEGQPLQDLESDVLGKLLSTAGATRGDPESQRRYKTAGNSDLSFILHLFAAALGID